MSLQSTRDTVANAALNASGRPQRGSEQLEDTKHTAGPWVVQQTAVYDAIYGAHGEMVSFVSIRETREARANARLIASAPELLAACKLAMVHYRDLRLNVRQALAAAIARAEGRAQ